MSKIFLKGRVNLENKNITVNINLINEYMKKHDKSLRCTAKEMNVSCSYLRKVINHEKNPGGKIIIGLVKLGYSTNKIFLEDSKKIDRKSVKEICNYMNSFANAYKENPYTIDRVYKIMFFSKEELKIRKKEGLNLYGNTKEGRNKIYERIAKLAQDNGVNITVNDVALFKRCQSIEESTRNVMSSSYEDELNYI